MTYYTIYKTTNLINGKFYIGKHQTENPNDRYFGSGKYLKDAIKKYGKENFKKDILFIFLSEKEMNIKEKEIITEDLVLREDTYNLGVGGEGGPHFKGKKHKKETIKKISKSNSNKPLTEERRKNISKGLVGRPVSLETRKKLSIRKHLASGKSIGEAILLADKVIFKNRRGKSKEEISAIKSNSMKEFYKKPENRKKKAEQMRKLHLEYDLEKLKEDFLLGLKPKEIMAKYELNKNRYYHIREYYLLD